MAIQTPAEVLPAARRESDGEGGVGKPLREQEDERGGGPPTCDHVTEVDAVVKPQVGEQALAVVVNQSREAEASPACVPPA